MTLKIRTEEGWRFIDDIKDFTVAENGENIEMQVKLRDATVQQITARAKENYLLNDEGKTIERL